VQDEVTAVTPRMPAVPRSSAFLEPVFRADDRQVVINPVNRPVTDVAILEHAASTFDGARCRDGRAIVRDGTWQVPT
jgi:hypothetical protein